jgi:hypothetical protein
VTRTSLRTVHFQNQPTVLTSIRYNTYSLNKKLWITSGVLIAILAIAIAAMLRYPGKASVKLRPEQCDAGLWQHVYEKDRLRVLENCTAVEGRVVSIHRAGDGDLHIGLDPQQKSVLNLFNFIHGHGELVVEVVCEHSPTKKAAQAACENFHSRIMPPQVGDRIRVTGTYVTDRDSSWNEIHPVTRIEILR